MLEFDTEFVSAAGATGAFEHKLCREGEDYPLARGTVKFTAVGKSCWPIRGHESWQSLLEGAR